MMADIERIKRNIGRMIKQNAPESDIDAYLDSEGVTAEQLRGESSLQPAPDQIFRNLTEPPPKQDQPFRSSSPLGMAAENFMRMGWKERGERSLKSVDDLVRATAGAMTFGAADELAAGARSLFSPKSFEELHQQEIQRDKEIPPGTFAAGTTAGALLGPGKLTSLLMKPVQKATTGVIPRALSYGGVGVAEGGAAGALYADPGKRVPGAVTGAAIGTLAATTIPIVAWGFGKAWSGVAAKLAERGAEQHAIRRIMLAMRRDDLTPEQALARADELGEGATLADVGRNISGQAEVAATRPGQALTKISETIEGRDVRQFPRVLKQLAKMIGPAGREAAETVDDFESSLDISVPLTNKLKRLFERPSMRTAWKRAQELAAEENKVLPDMAEVLQNPDYSGVQTRVLHWLKKGLDDVLEPKRAITGELVQEYGKNKLIALTSTRRAFREEVKTLNPKYGTALLKTGAKSRMNSAYEKGLKFMKMVDAADVGKIISGMNRRERRAFRQGVVNAMARHQVKRGNIGFDVTGQLLAHQHKFEIAFGRKQANRLMTTLKAERELRLNSGRMLANSRTAYRAQAIADDEGTAAAEMAIDAALGNKAGIISRIYRGITGWLRRPHEAVNYEIAKILMELDPQTRRRLIQKASQTFERAERVPQALTAGAVGASTPLYPAGNR